MIPLFSMEMESELWEEGQGPKDVRPTALTFTYYSQEPSR
jgi:hypothetical protein